MGGADIEKLYRTHFFRSFTISKTHFSFNLNLYLFYNGEKRYPKMKNKYLAVLMGAMLTVSLAGTAVTTMAADSTAEASEDAEETPESKESSSEETLGEVKSVEEGIITIATGTRKEMDRSGEGKNGGKPEQPEGEQDGEAPEQPEGGKTGEVPSMLELTGEELQITVTDSTVITKISMNGRPGDRENGEQSEDSGKNIRDREMATEEITLEDIQVGDVIAVTLDDNGNALTITVQSMRMGGGQGSPAGQESGGPGEQPSGVDSYEAAYEYTEDENVTDTSLDSTGTDENVALVSDGAEVTFSNDFITRTSADSTGGDNSSFYGVGAAVLATDGTAYVSGSTVDTDSKGGAGLFAYGDGTVYAADTTITTQQDTSGGIHAAGGGTLYAWDLNVETNGESSAAVRSDRGGGTMVVDGGTYISNGVGSPAVYCTADISINNAELIANGSEGICIEGLNTLRLYDSSLVGNMSDDEQNDTTWTVILYQSMSGDSEVGNSSFQMNGGSIASQNGGLFYTTNTECTIALKDVEITYNDDSEFFLQCTGNNNRRGWGNVGANGSDCLFTADSQDMKGNVIWDSVSNLDFYMTNGSTLQGAFVNDETYAGEGGDGYCNVYVDESSVWTVTGDSRVHALSNAGTITDADGKTVSIAGTDGTVYVEGDSEYTITVDSYEDTADTSGAAAMEDWSAHSVERPETL